MHLEMCHDTLARPPWSREMWQLLCLNRSRCRGPIKRSLGKQWPVGALLNHEHHQPVQPSGKNCSAFSARKRIHRLEDPPAGRRMNSFNSDSWKCSETKPSDWELLLCVGHPKTSMCQALQWALGYNCRETGMAPALSSLLGDNLPWV